MSDTIANTAAVAEWAKSVLRGERIGGKGAAYIASGDTTSSRLGNTTTTESYIYYTKAVWEVGYTVAVRSCTTDVNSYAMQAV